MKCCIFMKFYTQTHTKKENTADIREFVVIHGVHLLHDLYPLKIYLCLITDLNAKNHISNTSHMLPYLVKNHDNHKLYVGDNMAKTDTN